MVIHHDHLHPPLDRGLDLRDGGDPAVEGDEEPRPSGGQRLDGLRSESVAVPEAMGDVVVHPPGAAGPEKGAEESGGAHPVHVVIAEGGDRLVLRQGAGQAAHGRVHARESGRIGEVAEAPLQEALGLRGILEAAPPEELGDQWMAAEGADEPLGFFFRGENLPAHGPAS